MRRLLLFAVALGTFAVACGSEPAEDPFLQTYSDIEQSDPSSGELAGLKLTPIASGLAEPVWAVAPAGDERLFIVEKPGTVRILTDGEIKPEPFLDLTAEVSTDHLERGLLGLAFHPDFAANGRLVVFYTDRGGTSQLVEYRLEPNEPERVDLESARPLMAIDQFHPAHQGGAVAFGPDGYLWVTVGDGGIASDGEGGVVSDPKGYAQDPTTLHGSVLRIDIDSSDDDYAIPLDNPFVDGGGAPEVWSYGVRNPWRMEFDGDLVYVSDVGHEWWEEVNVSPVAESNLNYGWSIKEGPECFLAETCDETGLTEPTFELYHEGLCALVGGPVYRGRAVPELDGHFFYGDWCVGWIRSFKYVDGEITAEREWEELTDVGNLTSFGVDAQGEMYVMNMAGDLFRIDPVRE